MGSDIPSSGIPTDPIIVNELAVVADHGENEDVLHEHVETSSENDSNISSNSQNSNEERLMNDEKTSTSTSISTPFPTLAQQKRYQSRRTNKHKKYIDLTDPENIDLLIFPHRDTSLDTNAISRVSKQLGYLPYNLIKVGAYDTMDHTKPLVAVLYPLSSEKINGVYNISDKLKPFPTTYWLTDPVLQARISQLEKDGWITVFEDRLKENNYQNEYVDIMRRSHQLYIETRWELLQNSHKELVVSNKWGHALLDRGISGMRNFKAVKCLHTHYSHFLARPDHGNIIGRWVHELLLLSISTFHVVDHSFIQSTDEESGDNEENDNQQVSIPNKL